MKRYLPLKLVKYLSYEYIKCLLITLLVFLSIITLINFLEELIYFREKAVDNIFAKTIYLTLLKTPNTIIETSVFIFLFSGIFFFVKFIKNNEVNTIKLSGISNLIIILTPSLIAFVIGIFIISFLSPISSAALKIYEKNIRNYSQNDNLIIINDLGLWFANYNDNKYRIIRADKILNNDFTKLYNSTIYELDNEFNFIKRFDSKLIFINKKKWILENVSIFDEKINIKNVKLDELDFNSTIDINDLKNFFTNVGTVSFWEILQNIKNLNERGYSGDELKIKFHKYLSLPIYLFTMIIFSTVFTLNLDKNYSNFMYIFFGIVLGILTYFLNDLSIALGISNKIPLTISVWIPIFLIVVISSINLIKINEK